MTPNSQWSDKPPLTAWPDKALPSAIYYIADVLADLQMASVDGLLAIPRVGMGIGGLLLGRKVTGRIDILGAVEIVCSHAMGPAFVLTPEEVTGAHRLARQTANAPVGDEATMPLKVVGWYCSKTSGPLTLSDSDKVLYEVVCPEPWQVALLIKPSQASATRGMFTFRGHRSFGERASTFRLGAQHEFAKPDADYQYRPPEPQPLPLPDRSEFLESLETPEAELPETDFRELDMSAGWSVPPRPILPKPLYRGSGEHFAPVKPSVEAHAERLASLDPEQAWPELQVSPVQEPGELQPEEPARPEPGFDPAEYPDLNEEFPGAEHFPDQTQPDQTPEEEPAAPGEEAETHPRAGDHWLPEEPAVTTEVPPARMPERIPMEGLIPRKRRRWPLVLAIIFLLLALAGAAAWILRDRWLSRVFPPPPVALIASSDWTQRVTFLWNAEALADRDHATLELADGKGALITLHLKLADVARGLFQYDCVPGTYSVTLLSGSLADTITVRVLPETYLPESGISK